MRWNDSGSEITLNSTEYEDLVRANQNANARADAALNILDSMKPNIDEFVELASKTGNKLLALKLDIQELR